MSEHSTHSHNIIHSRNTNYYLTYHYNSSVGYTGMRYNSGSLPMNNEDGYLITDSASVAHTHSFTSEYSGGTESRPNNFTSIIWKRII